jgi:hypothetical protein
MPELWPTFWLKFQKYAKGLGLYHLLTEDGSKVAKLKDSADFDKNDHQLQTLLVGTLSEGAVHLVEYCESTYDMVQRLQSQYHSSSGASIVFKLDQALDLNYDEDTKMSNHLGKLNALVNQIQSSGDLTIDKLHVVLMLRSIPQNEYCHRVTGDGAKIEGMGSVVYEATLSNGSKTKITWQEVYYIPTFKVNIT